MRLVYAAGAVAAVSAATAGLVQFGNGGDASASIVAPPAVVPAQDVPVRHVIRYVHLKPGQNAPPGAKVITAKAPAPRIVVTHIAAPVRRLPPTRVIVTHQSGRP
jgi:hypothetical protein